MQSEKLSKDAATDLWKKIVTEGSAEGSTVARLNSRLTSERILTKLKDEDYEASQQFHREIGAAFDVAADIKK